MKLILLIETNNADRYKETNEVLIAYNEAYWSWEYDTQRRMCYIFLNLNNTELRYVITNTHIKSGLGAGTTNSVLERGSLGTIWKPKQEKLKTALRKYNLTSSRAGYGWSQKWTSPKDKKDSLGNLIKTVQQYIKKNPTWLSGKNKIIINNKLYTYTPFTDGTEIERGEAGISRTLHIYDINTNKLIGDLIIYIDGTARLDIGTKSLSINKDYRVF